MKRRYVELTEGDSKLSGYNVGKYPLHKFSPGYYRNLPHVAIPLRLVAVGDDEWVAGCLRKRENSSTFALEFVQEGVFHFTQNGNKYDVMADEIFLVHKNEDCEMTVDAYATKKTMIIDGSSIRPIIKQLGLEDADVIKVSQPDELREKFDYTCQVCKEMKPGFSWIASSMAYQVLLILANDHQYSAYPRVLTEILNYMQENLLRPLTIHDLCHQSGMSSVSLNRLFARYLNSSPIDYLIKMKMSRAEELLFFPQYSIKEISQMLGYSNQLYFSAEFKKRIGLSPKAYRNRK